MVRGTSTSTFTKWTATASLRFAIHSATFLVSVTRPAPLVVAANDHGEKLHFSRDEQHSAIHFERGQLVNETNDEMAKLELPRPEKSEASDYVSTEIQ